MTGRVALAAGRAGIAGFTLVEVMVALALTGLVSLVMLQGVALAAHGLDRLSQRSERLDERRGLETLMGRALATAVAVPASDGAPAFVGRPTSVAFLSVADDGGPGLYRITLALGRVGSQPAVTLTRRRAEGSVMPRREESVLVNDVRAFGIAYFGAVSPGADPAWHRHWEGVSYLPQLVRIIVERIGGREEPPIVLRLSDAG
ncbi:MAG TPA: prepilin-type N-terminal cleavage/methylation domain-containing protein [Stellaceae bacterium]|nr:prepilin-type N-terminal cleavage/methylation domain-containing protein [Stellaceae bacterium]